MTLERWPAGRQVEGNARTRAIVLLFLEGSERVRRTLELVVEKARPKSVCVFSVCLHVRPRSLAISNASQQPVAQVSVSHGIRC